MSQSVSSPVAATLLALLRSVGLLIFELIATILVYSFLSLYQRELFGFLARMASEFMNFLIGQLLHFIPDATNTAYATLVGELGPKAMLLLMIGLVVGAIVRFVGWFVHRQVAG